MSLSTGLDIARSSLSVNADRASLVARNIASADDPHASRKVANLVTADGGGARVAAIAREVDAGLVKLMQSSASEHARHAAIAEGLDTIQQVIGSPDQETSPAAGITRLRDSLLSYAAAPHDVATASSAIASAHDVVHVLNEANDHVQRVRAEADADINAGVERLNELLSDFDRLNNEVISGTRLSRDVTDDEDERAGVLAAISELIDIRTVSRSDNDLVIMTNNSLVLYEAGQRTVSFQPTGSFDASVSGSPIYVDGMPITGVAAREAAHSGRLVGLAKVRDDLAVTAQSQLDEMARGLVTLFAETDQNSSGAATQPGLFTYGGAPVMPAAGTLVDGLAGSIAVNKTVDPSQGGDINLLRDGGISDPGNAAYIYNTDGGAGYSARLQALSDALGEPFSFDGVVGISVATDLMSFSTDSVSWLQDGRRTATDKAIQSAGVLERATVSLSNATGVSLDEEMTLMLEIERSYQASARLMSTIDTMYEALFTAAR